MKKSLLVCFVLLCSCIALNASSSWRTYLSYSDISKNYVVGNRVYTLANKSLFYYDVNDASIHQLTKIEGLSDVSISYMVYNKELECFLLVYDDFNMDILTSRNEIINIPQYKNSSLQDKTINNVTVSDKNAYLSTNFGVVVVNMERGEISNTYDIGIKATCATATDNCIYVTTAKGIYAGYTNKNLLDIKNWSLFSTRVVNSLFTFEGDLYLFYSNTGLYAVDESNAGLKTIIKGAYKSINTEGNKLTLWGTASLATIDKNLKSKTYVFNNSVKWASGDSACFWVSNGTIGLQSLVQKGDTLTLSETAIIPNGPVRNLCYKMSYTPQNRLLVAGGSLNYTGIYNIGTVMMYDANGWTNFQDTGLDDIVQYHYYNVTGVAQDPHDDTHHYVTAACGGLFEFRNGKFEKLYDAGNSPIMSILPTNVRYKYYTRTSGAIFDKDDNVWLLNNQVDTLLHVLKKDGTWKSFCFTGLEGYPTFDHIIFDSRGWAWMTHRRKTSSHLPGVLCFNYNGTIDNASDDQWQFCTNFGSDVDVNNVYNVVEDKDGNIWVSTDKGPFIMKSPQNVFTTAKFERVIVPRNDGTDYGDYLLSGVPINQIAIDGGNRKWFATSDDGVYLTSADGLTILEHFTTDNSPLLSNVVYSIAIQPESGEVMMGTDGGIVSYMANATEPAENLESSNLKVYPNPVRPEYEGDVKVNGWTADSEVKVTTATGQLVAKGTSVGGTFSWNCRTSAGKRVASGVYYFIGTDQDGKKGATAKVLIIK